MHTYIHIYIYIHIHIDIHVYIYIYISIHFLLISPSKRIKSFPKSLMHHRYPYKIAVC